MHTYTAILYLKLQAETPEAARVLMEAAAAKLDPAEVMRLDFGTILPIPDPKE